MLKAPLLAGLLALTTGLSGQTTIPSGTILPLQLNCSLNSKKSKPGQLVTARLMQDVPLPSGARIRAGSKAIGHILDVVEAKNGGGANLSLQFDTLEVSKRRIPMTTNLRALASMMEVEEAQIPKTGPDRGTSENSWTTEQIGGDVVYRGGGPVTNGLGVVGTPAADGVLVRIASKSGTECRGGLSGNQRLQALWVFSADACGTYGFLDLRIVHAGRSNPMGQITLASAKSNFDVRSGSGLLLHVK
ncbi:MAG: hypothetical protein LAO30_20130 [Acidobacteriia bacterium]|nr:hypothetical protein [Terriglobia bacterium]